MNKSPSASGVLLCALTLTILSLGVPAFAQPPDDNWYAGGPDGVTIEGLKMSETWTLRGETDHLDGHVKMEDKKITLLKHGARWFLIPDEDFGWSSTPMGTTIPPIPLDDHPGFNPSGSANQWRWISNPPVWIEGNDGVKHKHIVCVGFPDEQPRRDDEKMCVAVKDRETNETNCADLDCDLNHPGHSNADR